MSNEKTDEKRDDVDPKKEGPLDSSSEERRAAESIYAKLRSGEIARRDLSTSDLRLLARNPVRAEQSEASFDLYRRSEQDSPSTSAEPARPREAGALPPEEPAEGAERQSSTPTTSPADSGKLRSALRGLLNAGKESQPREDEPALSQGQGPQSDIEYLIRRLRSSERQRISQDRRERLREAWKNWRKTFYGVSLSLVIFACIVGGLTYITPVPSFEIAKRDTKKPKGPEFKKVPITHIVSAVETEMEKHEEKKDAKPKPDDTVRVPAKAETPPAAPGLELSQKQKTEPPVSPEAVEPADQPKAPDAAKPSAPPVPTAVPPVNATQTKTDEDIVLLRDTPDRRVMARQGKRLQELHDKFYELVMGLGDVRSFAEKFKAVREDAATAKVDVAALKDQMNNLKPTTVASVPRDVIDRLAQVEEATKSAATSIADLRKKDTQQDAEMNSLRTELGNEKTERKAADVKLETRVSTLETTVKSLQTALDNAKSIADATGAIPAEKIGAILLLQKEVAELKEVTRHACGIQLNTFWFLHDSLANEEDRKSMAVFREKFGDLLRSGNSAQLSKFNLHLWQLSKEILDRRQAAHEAQAKKSQRVVIKTYRCNQS